MWLSIFLCVVLISTTFSMDYGSFKTAVPPTYSSDDFDEKLSDGTTEKMEVIDASRLDLRIGKVVDVKKHPEADLFITKIDIGKDSKTMTVVTGLLKYITKEQLLHRMVVVICNLLPTTQRGIVSEGMMLYATLPYQNAEFLIPPPGSVPGDLIHIEGFPRTPDLKLDDDNYVFENLARFFTTDKQRRAVYKYEHQWLVPGKGFVTTATLAEAIIK